MLNRLLIVLSLSAVPAAGAAQQAPPGLPAPVRETGVTLTVAGYLLPSTSGRLAVPLPLLEQLAGENALLAVDTAPVGGRILVQVRFGFTDVGAFQRWYTDERTVRLLNEVRSITISGSFETFLSYRPGAGP